MTILNRRYIIAEGNGGFPVNVQDQATKPFSLRLSQSVSTGLTLALDTVVNTYTATYSPGHGITVGQDVAIFDVVQEKVFYGGVLNVAVDTITFDTPFPVSFTAANSTSFSYIKNMAIDGSVDAEVFEFANYLIAPIDVTRILFHIVSGNPMDTARFGSIAGGLGRGIVLRKYESPTTYTNYWNAKTNGDIGELMFDVRYEEKAPAGEYGLNARMTYAGQDKHGVVIRLEQGQSLQLVIQDDLTTQTSFTATVEGHLTQT